MEEQCALFKSLKLTSQEKYENLFCVLEIKIRAKSTIMIFLDQVKSHRSKQFVRTLEKASFYT